VRTSPNSFQQKIKNKLSGTAENGFLAWTNLFGEGLELFSQGKLLPDAVICEQIDEIEYGMCGVPRQVTALKQNLKVRRSICLKARRF